MILTGIVAFAQSVGQQRLEEELLPQCWEQVGLFKAKSEVFYRNEKVNMIKIQVIKFEKFM